MQLIPSQTVIKKSIYFTFIPGCMYCSFFILTSNVCSCSLEKSANINSISCEGGDCGISGEADAISEIENRVDAISEIESGSDANDRMVQDEDSGIIPCISDEECGDGIFCNGEEICIISNTNTGDGRCAPAFDVPCVPCFESSRRCDCDIDGDGIQAIACGGTDCDDDGDGDDDKVNCGGTDCDDQNPRAKVGLTEVCDEFGLDEDCDPDTVHNETNKDDIIEPIEPDPDGDGYITLKCFNKDPMTGKIISKGDDCDDTDPEIHPDADEKCDYKDNNCNHKIDEDSDGNELGQRTKYYPDIDNDGWAAAEDKDTKLSCSRPQGYIDHLRKDAFDCDDKDLKVYPGAHELCDNKDNDCDGKTDEENDDGSILIDQPTSTDTIVKCEKGKWVVKKCPPDRLDCDGDASQGCETIVTTLDACRACSTNCLFSCGREGCDEITDKVQKIAVGFHHTCAVTDEGTATCWGHNSDGRLGDGTMRGSLVPTRVAIPSEVSAISAGDNHTCAIAGYDKKVFCWGNNSAGQLGISPSGNYVDPNRTQGVWEPELTKASSISNGSEHSCAVYDEGLVACWGNQGQGRIGNGETEADIVWSPENVYNENWSEIQDGQEVAVGDTHSCLLDKNGKVKCWGNNDHGQLGYAQNTDPVPLAQEVPNLSDIKMIVAGRRHTCALSSSGSVFCWGDNRELQLGHPENQEDAMPTEVPRIGLIVAISAGTTFTCALTDKKEVLCWGSNEGGERGDQNYERSDQPTTIRIDEVDTMAAGGIVCARTVDKQLWCWGDNFFGQLGNGTSQIDAEPNPQRVSPLQETVP